MTLIQKSELPGIYWPAVLSPEGTARLATMYQLEQTQWWTPEELASRQFQQINELLRHAFNTTTFYRERLKSIGFDEHTEITQEMFSNIPLLQREDIQSELENMSSKSVPKSHGKIRIAKSSGSTGKPIKIFSTSASQFFWQAFSLRDHLWHKRDFTKKHGTIRVGVKSGTVKNWGPAVNAAFTSAPCVLLNIKEDISSQIKWVREHTPYYLLSYPSNLREMARICIESNITFPGLGEARTFGETVTDDIRDICRQAWGVDTIDTYSAMEIGVMALQCLDHEHYHVMSEGVFMEILDDDGHPCKPGEIGRVVITDLHNFATPMIRYEILDYAEVGEQCPCGRGLPVLKRILGRQRNLLKLPDGTVKWPSTSIRSWSCASKIRQAQFVQKEIDLILIKLVLKETLNQDDDQEITRSIQKSIGYPFRVKFEYPGVIARPKNFKFDIFICEV